MIPSKEQLQYNILLTGADGFIGRSFIKYQGDNFNITPFEGDIRDIKLSIFENFDYVVHLAGLAGVRLSHQIPEEFWDNNVEGSKAVFREADYAHIPVIYASSSSVYEWWLSPYATTKKVVEKIAGRRDIGLRFHTVYGDNSRPDMLYDRLLKKDPTIKYITNHTRDYTHVEDVCSAIAICIKQYLSIDEKVIDVGWGTPVRVVDVANKYWPDNNLPIKEVTGEREHTCANPDLLIELGWTRKHFIL